MAGDQQAWEREAVGPFRLVSELGAGSFGNVYLGRSASGRLVAVKVIRRELASDMEFRERFAREVAAARRVNSPFTVQVIDADVDGPRPWLATAYVAGPSLDRAVEENGPLPVESVRKLAVGLAEGLRKIHAAGIVHRDLKPSNVLLADDGPRIIDFGIASVTNDGGLSGTRMIIGTPEYMSPEQAAGRPAGPASDVFSLGAVLFYAATGEGPFGGGSTPSQLYRVVSEPPRLDRVPAVIRPLIERILTKDPSHRPSPEELLAEFEHSARRPDERSPVAADETGQRESQEGVPHTGPGEGPGFAESGGMPQGATSAPGRHGRGKPGHGAAPPREIGQEAASRNGDRESRSFYSSVGQLRKLAAQVFSRLIPPEATAVLQADHHAEQEEALRYIEAEITRAYSALGLPPGLERSVGGGRSDV